MVDGARAFPPTVEYRLSGWDLLWIELTVKPPVKGLTELCQSAPSRIRHILTGLPPAEHPVVQSVRGLFRNAGCDPTRYRPSSEALVRRLEKGEPIPSLGPAVDFNNLLSVELLVPCCVLEPEAIAPPVVLRRGRPGEIMDSMRGPFTLDNKPVLSDADGPFGSPITDSEKVKVKNEAGVFWMVVYLPRAAVPRDRVSAVLKEKGARLSGLSWKLAPA